MAMYPGFQELHLYVLLKYHGLTQPVIFFLLKYHGLTHPVIFFIRFSESILSNHTINENIILLPNSIENSRIVRYRETLSPLGPLGIEYLKMSDNKSPHIIISIGISKPNLLVRVSSEDHFVFISNKSIYFPSSFASLFAFFFNSSNFFFKLILTYKGLLCV